MILQVTGYLGQAVILNDLQNYLKQERLDAVGHTVDVELVNGGTNPQQLNATQLKDGIALEVMDLCMERG